jgi:glucose-6-phosphate isomerase
MRVDIGNATARVATPGLDGPDLERLDDEVADAHDRIARGMADDEFGYASLTLPDRTDPDGIREAVAPVAADSDAVLTVGIGGSALGAATITRALGLEDHYVLDNVDPAHTTALLDHLDFDRLAVNVVSKSGTTAETLANFLVVREAMTDAGVDWTGRTVVTTGGAGPLRDLVREHDLPALDVPEGVPGRFSALSSVGLVPAAVLADDATGLLEGVLAGGRDARESLAGSLTACPAYAYGAVAAALEREGAHVNAVVPYAEALEPFAEWFAQLWAESLGKGGRGQTPARALGATDQHSQLQLYRAGRHDKLVTLVRPREPGGSRHADRQIPDTDAAGLAYLGDASLGELLDAEFAATEASLAEAGQPNVRVELDRLDARGVGDLLYSMEAACVLAGELLDVETFTQPAVEWGKRAARGLLGGGDFPEAETVRDKHEHVVE